MASSCISGLYGLRNPYLSKLKVQLPPPQARSQSFRDDDEQGKSSNTVDANMSTLRCRIERLRMRERQNYKLGHGWNYKPGYDDVLKKHSMLISSFQLLTIVVNSIGLVFLIGSLCIFLVSFIFSTCPN